MTTTLSPSAERILRKRFYIKDEDGNPIESWPDLVTRVVSHVCEGESDEFKDKIGDEIYHRRFLPNSPCLVNAGTKNKGYAACYVIPNDRDSIEGIINTLHEFAQVARKGGGGGTTLNHIRPKGERVTSSAHTKACGAVEVMRMISEVTRSITQAGFRAMANAANMRIDHPEIIEFITCKSRESALRSLLQEDITGLYDSLSGNLSPQLEIILDRFISNFNISVALPDWFMDCVIAGEMKTEFPLWFNLHGVKKEYGTLVVGDVWDLIIDNAWKTGDPGCLFVDTVNSTTPYRVSGQVLEATNPCFEQPLPNHGVCNLGSISLEKFWHPYNGMFEFEKFGAVVRLAIRFLDNVVSTMKYPNEDFAQWAKENRPIGLGLMGLADLLLLMKLKYDSQEARDFCGKIAEYMYEIAHDESIRLGAKKGPAKNANYPELDRRRNVTLLSIAPTGTISQIAGCWGQGIEPGFSPQVWRYDNTTNEGGELTEHPEANEDYFQCALDVVGDREVSLEGHVKMQAVWNRFVDSGCSKTINLPYSATREDVERAYILAYAEGCRGITVYRDGCKKVQVLNNVESDLFKGDGHPREPILLAKVFDIQSPYMNGGGRLVNIRWHIFVGIQNGRPYEVFARRWEREIPAEVEVLRIKSKHYLVKDLTGEVIFDNILQGEFPEVDHETRRISLELRHGIPLQYIVGQIHKTTLAANSFAKALGRVCREFLSEEELKSALKPHGKCEECGSEDLEYEFQSGCVMLLCKNCGYSLSKCD